MKKNKIIKLQSLLENINNSFSEENSDYSPLTKDEKRNLINIMENYNAYRNALKANTIHETIKKLSEAVILAERYVISECNEWLEADMAKKDLKEVRKIIAKMNLESKKIKDVEHNIERLYEDAGIRLDRYFDIK